MAGVLSRVGLGERVADEDGAEHDQGERGVGSSLGVAGPVVKVGRVDGRQNGAENDEVAEASAIEQMQPAPGDGSAGNYGGDHNAGPDGTIQ